MKGEETWKLIFLIIVDVMAQIFMVTQAMYTQYAVAAHQKPHVLVLVIMTFAAALFLVFPSQAVYSEPSNSDYSFPAQIGWGGAVSPGKWMDLDQLRHLLACDRGEPAQNPQPGSSAEIQYDVYRLVRFSDGWGSENEASQVLAALKLRF